MVDFDFPLHWDKLMLFQVATEQKISNKNIHHQNLLSLSYGNIKRKDINTHGGLLPTSFDTYQIVNAGNIILRLTDLQNDHKSLRVGLVTETGIITSAYTCLKARENILPQFLYLLLHAYDLNKIFYGMGGGVRQSIGYSDIRKMTIALPPLEEQEKIVRYLDKKTSQISTYINAKKKEIELLGELKHSIISDAVTNKHHSKTSAQWKKIKLKYIAKIYNGNSISDAEKDKYTTRTTIPYIATKDVNLDYCTADYENGLFVPEESTFKIASAGSTLLCIEGGSAGKKKSYVTRNVAFVNKLCALIPKKIHSKFLFYAISSSFFKCQFDRKIAGMIGGVALRDIKNFQIIVPPLKHQREIVDYLDAKCAKIERLIEALQNEIKFVEELKTRIISDVVTGKIDVRELT